ACTSDFRRFVIFSRKLDDSLRRLGSRRVGLTRVRLSTFDREQTPLAGDAAQLMRAAIGEAQTRARDEIFDRTGHEHFTRTRARGDARADVHCDAAEIVADGFALAGVETGANLETERTDRVANRGRATNRACRTIERREESVADRFHFATAKASELAPG